MTEPSKREKNSTRKNAGCGKSAEANFKEALFEHKINWLAKLDPSSAESNELFTELTAESSKANQIQVRVFASPKKGSYLACQITSPFINKLGCFLIKFEKLSFKNNLSFVDWDSYLASQ